MDFLTTIGPGPLAGPGFAADGRQGGTVPILNELFGTWIGWLSMFTIAFIIGMAIFIFVYVSRQMK